MKDYKNQVIKQYIETKLTMTPERQALLFERVAPMCQIQKTIKYQDLESPGSANEGRLWLSTQAMVHSYYYNKTTGATYGTQIWKKNEIILFASSLLRGEDRTHYIQMLEPGIVLSMSYRDALTLREEFPEVSAHIEQIIVHNEQASQHRILLLNEPSCERIVKFEAENSLFCNIASVGTKAMHVGLTRQGYTGLKKKLMGR
ncbi:hypothetical protein [Sphingobacterium anhuiense]|uniref:Uncharacterized protein n=1 Tax=Sphingobacterium anhuiense TaxID=493780 RepID=A0ABW5YYT4_9SPHI